MGRINASKVAELAGVSRTAVSRSFSGKGRVSPKTRKKVMEAVAQLGYRPNGLASSLARKSSDIVALINGNDYDLREAFFIQSLSKSLFERGLTPLMLSVHNDDTGEDSLDQFLRFPLLTAIVSADSVEARFVIPHCEFFPPIMLNENFRVTDNVDIVHVDEAKGIAELIAFLKGCDARTLWFISGRRTTSAHSSRRMAVLEAVAESDLRIADSENGDFSYESGAAATRALAARGAIPDAVFAANDLMAMGAMDVLRYQLGVKVPEQTFVAGFDDIPQAAWPTYCLPSVRQSDDAIIEAIQQIINERTNDTMPQTRLRKDVPTRFVLRGILQ